MVAGLHLGVRPGAQQQHTTALLTYRIPERLQGLPHGLSRLGLQAAGEFLHLRRDIDMVMHDLPPPGFPAVDVGDAVFERDALARQPDLPALGADLVGQVPASV